MSEDKAPVSESITRLLPNWQLSSRISAFSTTRLGGVSQPPYDSMNLGLHVDDDAERVIENRRLLHESFALPSKPCWLNQTHSANVLRINPAAGLPDSNDSGISSRIDPLHIDIPSADGAWTNQSGTVLTVLTADCLPVLISDSKGEAVAAIHAGWRGLAAGILENATAMFDQQSDLHAWLGPAIGPAAFEVGEEVRQAFAERNPAHEAAFKPGLDKGKYWCDLYALARLELQLSRAVNVSGGEYCTHSQPRLFHSHRRDGVRSGRMATLIWITPER